MRIRFVSLALAAVAWLAACSHSRAGVVTSLDNPVVAGNTATLDVTFLFSGSPADTLEAFQISVLGSDPLLTANGTDFSRFDFTANPALFSAWVGTPPDLGTSGFTFFTPIDVVSGPFLSPSATPYLLGTLTVDLSGIAAGTSVTVTVAGNDPLFPTLALGTVGGTFDQIPMTFSQPGGVQLIAAIPEPSAAVLLGVGLGVLAARRWRRSQIAG